MKAMSKDEKKDLGFKLLTDHRYAVNLSESDIDHIEKSGKYSSQQIQEIKNARKEGFKAIAEHGSTIPTTSKNPNRSDAKIVNSQRAALFASGSQDVAKLPAEIFSQKDMVPHLTPQVLDNRMRAGDLKTSDIDKIRQALKDYLDPLVHPVPPATLPAPNSKEARYVEMWKKWATNNRNMNSIIIGKLVF
jgi:hypothetical protein